jgi:hypothetical protein
VKDRPFWVRENSILPMQPAWHLPIDFSQPNSVCPGHAESDLGSATIFQLLRDTFCGVICLVLCMYGLFPRKVFSSRRLHQYYREGSVGGTVQRRQPPREGIVPAHAFVAGGQNPISDAQSLFCSLQRLFRCIICLV